MYRDEGTLRDTLVNALQIQGREVAAEFPLLGRLVDVVAFDKDTGCLTAYECKLTDWRRALAQARRHLPACDQAYVVMPKRPYAILPFEPFIDAGVGLILVDDGVCHTLVTATITTDTPFLRLRDRALDHLRSRVNHENPSHA